jgi:hypothetical protein
MFVALDAARCCGVLVLASFPHFSATKQFFSVAKQPIPFLIRGLRTQQCVGGSAAAQLAFAWPVQAFIKTQSTKPLPEDKGG